MIIMKNNLIYKLYSCCIPAKGYKQSIICDIQRNNSWLIPNSVCDFLIENNEFSSKTINIKFLENTHEIICFLIDNEIVFNCKKSETENFIPIDLSWRSPNLISSCIIDLKSNAILNHVFEELNKIGCNKLQFRFYSKITINELITYLKQLKRLHIKSFELLIPYSENMQIDVLQTIPLSFPILSNITVYSSPMNSFYFNNNCSFIYTKEIVKSQNSCGVIEKEYFSCNMGLFTESQLHNTCLNRKICIDADGEIKNCPSMKQSYGNIKDTTLREAMEKPGFKDLWFICKDKIDVCKDCEFRYMCTDCLTFIKDPENIYSQPAKCPYNPYIAKWQGEEGYVPIEECGTYTKEKGFVVNKRKVNKLNKEIWGE